MRTKSLLSITLLLLVYQLNAGNFNNLPTQSSFGKDTLEGADKGIKGKLMITAGAGLNILPYTLKFNYAQKTDWKSTGDQGYVDLTVRSTPLFYVAVDYGILKNLSAGIAVGSQTATVNIEARKHNFMNATPGNYTDNWKRIHISTRADYYIIRKKNSSLYTGLKLCYNRYSMTSTLTLIMPEYPAKLSVSDVTPFTYGIQAHFGYSYYFKGIIGLNAEAGIGVGGPYVTAIGLTVKI